MQQLLRNGGSFVDLQPRIDLLHMEDDFDLQNQVAVSVAGIIEPTLQAAEIHRSTARPTNDLTAYDLYLRALSHLQSWQKDEIVLALDLVGEAIKRDPHYGSAIALAARCQFVLDANDWTNDPESTRREGVDLARRALGAVADDPVVLGNAAFVLAYFGEDIDAAMELIDRALALNPSFACGWRDSGFIRLYAGQPDAAINHLETYLRLNPRADRAAPYMGIGMGHLFARRFEEAKAMLLRGLQERPTYLTAHRFLASCYAHMGRIDEAREAVRQLLAITTVVMPSSAHFRNPEHRELFLSGLRMEVIARGVRNTQGFAWHPVTKEMWFTDHGRDWMGDNEPEDELNRMSKTGANFGFPYCHANGMPDKDIKRANPCDGVTLPATTMGPHAAVMGVLFYTGTMFPAEYRNAMFVARKGSCRLKSLKMFLASKGSRFGCLTGG